MSSCKDATIEAFNGYIGGLRSEPDAEIEFTFLQFDSMSLDKICVAAPISDVKELTPKSYEPRASTPLIDSCVKTIKAVEESLSRRDDKPKIVICFQTDGQENCSTEYSWNELNALIKEKSALGWQFNFMGTGIDAYAHAGRMGIVAECAMSYDRTDAVATKQAFAASASNTASFAAGRSANTFYSAQQRMAARDQFAPDTLRAQPPSLKMPATTQPPAKKPIVDDIKL